MAYFATYLPLRLAGHVLLFITFLYIFVWRVAINHPGLWHLLQRGTGGFYKSHSLSLSMKSDLVLMDLEEIWLLWIFTLSSVWLVCAHYLWDIVGEPGHSFRKSIAANFNLGTIHFPYLSLVKANYATQLSILNIPSKLLYYLPLGWAYLNSALGLITLD